jgi:hypothetical protein
MKRKTKSIVVLLYYTNYIKNKVTCCDMNGKVQWEFCDENVLVTPGGITTDSNNNIYVAGFRPNNVVVNNVKMI